MQDDSDLYEACRRECRGALRVRRLMNRLGIPHALTGRPPSLRKTWWRLTGGRRLVLAAFRYAAAARQTERLLEKTPNHALYLPEIAATFPDAAVLWIHRHPVDVFASYRRRGETEISRGLTKREDNRWLRVTPAIFCARHRQFTQALRRAVADGGLPIHIQSYEGFTAGPKESFAGICRFLGVPYRDEPVSGGSGEIDDPRDPLLSSPISSQRRDWTELVTADECRRIEEGLAGDMAYLGHERRHAR